MQFLHKNFEKNASLEDDLTKLQNKNENISWFMRMALVYRSEKKKIIRNHLDLIGLLQGLID